MVGFSRSRRSALVGFGGVGLAFMGTFAASYLFRPEEAVGDDFCPEGDSGPVTAVIVDSSNPLAAKSQEMLRAAVSDGMPSSRSARLIVARVNGARDYQPEFLLNRCDPGSGQAARTGEGRATRDALRADEFVQPLEKALAELAKPVDSNDRSFLADTIMRVAADPAMHLVGSNSTLIFLSDLLEHSDVSSPYSTGTIILPKFSEKFLTDIAVRVIELPAMAEAAALQTHDTRQLWRDWLANAGAARVELIAPGIAPSEQ